eukprot:Gb_41627 [translate_table: standard]
MAPYAVKFLVPENAKGSSRCVTYKTKVSSDGVVMGRSYRAENEKEKQRYLSKCVFNNSAMQPTRLSTMAISNTHGEDSPYFAGWKEYDRNPYHSQTNPSGVIQMGLAENQLSFDMLEAWLHKHPDTSICTEGGIARFREIASYQDYHGLPAFRTGIANFMEEIRGRRVKFDPDRIVLTAGATAAHELLTFCLGDPGEAFLVPSPYYPGFDRDLQWRTGVKLIPVHCYSSNNFEITRSALESAYHEAQNKKVTIRGVLITNPSNPLGTIMGHQTLKSILSFVCEKKIHLVCDEIYSGSVFSAPKFVSIAEILGSGDYKSLDNVHIIYSLSKDIGLSGFRVGVIYSYNDRVVTTARRMSSFSLVSSQTQHLLANMLSDTKFVQEYIPENHKRLRERHTMIVAGLQRAGIECLKSNAALFCWVDLRHLLPTPNEDGELRLWQMILEEWGLNVSPGSSCHCIEPGWFRFCFANMNDQTLDISLKRIQRFMDSRRRSTVCR